MYIYIYNIYIYIPQSPRTLESKVLAEGTWKGTFHEPRNDVACRGFCLFALKVMSQYFKLSVALDCSRLLSIALDCSRFSMLSEVLFEVLELLFEVLELLFEVLQNKCSRLLSIALDYSRSLSMTHGIVACTLTVQTMPRGLPFWGAGPPKVLS